MFSNINLNQIVVMIVPLLFSVTIFKWLWQTSIFNPFILDLYSMLFYSVVINLVLAIFNLIPIPPLDGSKILAVCLPAPLRIQFARLERFGMIIIIFLLLTNLLDKLLSFFFDPDVQYFAGKIVKTELIINVSDLAYETLAI
jgi:Zn-dependent protease